MGTKIKGVYVLSCYFLMVVHRTEADGLLVNMQRVKEMSDTSLKISKSNETCLTPASQDG